MRKIVTGDVVLVVDDSPDTVRLLTDVLDDARMTVMVALDGSSALKIAARLRPDIVLMDAVMPGLDGFETCRQLKQLSGFDNVPIIFMTGLSEPEDAVRAFQAGGADYVTKPIMIDAMMARINVHLANAKKIQTARMALDAAEQFLVAVDPGGHIKWFTPQAYRLLEERFPRGDGEQLRLPDDVRVWLLRHAARDRKLPDTANHVIAIKEHYRSQITLVGETVTGESLLRISDASPEPSVEILKARFGLTRREAEVVSWIARGKSNRDIAAILALSPRTVGKHVELILTKLNVENRTAAAALILGPNR